jgi:hypothetical protein
MRQDDEEQDERWVMAREKCKVIYLPSCPSPAFMMAFNDDGQSVERALMMEQVLVMG